MDRFATVQIHLGFHWFHQESETTIVWKATFTTDKTVESKHFILIKRLRRQ